MRAQLVAALEESLCVAPDPEDVLAGMRAGIQRRRRRRRTVAVLGAVLLALVTSSVTIWAVRDRPDVPPAAGTEGGWRAGGQAGWVPAGRPLGGVNPGRPGE